MNVKKKNKLNIQRVYSYRRHIFYKMLMYFLWTMSTTNIDNIVDQ